eukprot:CAMPEP_0168731564 /NCGR_PEP_ID=MMETSP0724-20121128/7326_1 /TAXON_ID=265536 /ORGANISM="Amphiprora sp., Strain CCMP467" /LENGTH=631 /DNA_ID=CAMNT_0008778567 /DNA_START=65 /DNA_END=1960 /DNA_ORIENTATION=+
MAAEDHATIFLEPLRDLRNSLLEPPQIVDHLRLLFDDLKDEYPSNSPQFLLSDFMGKRLDRLISGAEFESKEESAAFIELVLNDVPLDFPIDLPRVATTTQPNGAAEAPIQQFGRMELDPRVWPDSGHEHRGEGPTANPTTTAAPASTSMVDGIVGSQIAVQYPHKKHFFSHSNNIDPGDNSWFDDITWTVLEEKYPWGATRPANLPTNASLINSVEEYCREENLEFFMFWQPIRVEDPLQKNKRKWIIRGIHPPTANLNNDNWKNGLFREVRPTMALERHLATLKKNFKQGDTLPTRPFQEYLDSRNPAPAALPTSPHAAAAMPQHNQDSPGSPGVAIDNGTSKKRPRCTGATSQNPVSPEIKDKLRQGAMNIIEKAYDEHHSNAKKSSNYLNHPSIRGHLTVWEFAIKSNIAKSDHADRESCKKAEELDEKRQDALKSLIITPWKKWEECCLKPLKIDPWVEWDEGCIPAEIFETVLVGHLDMDRWICELFATALHLDLACSICHMRKKRSDETAAMIGRPYWCDLDPQSHHPEFKKHVEDRKHLDGSRGCTFNKRLWMLLWNKTLKLYDDPDFKPFLKPAKRPLSADEVREIFVEYLADGTVKELSETYVKKVCIHLGIPYQEPLMTE